MKFKRSFNILVNYQNNFKVVSVLNFDIRKFSVYVAEPGSNNYNFFERPPRKINDPYAIKMTSCSQRYNKKTNVVVFMQILVS